MLDLLSLVRPRQNPPDIIPDAIVPTAHFIYGLWDTGAPPKNLLKNMRLWARQGWKTQLWGRSEVDALYTDYPEFKQLAQAFQRPVMEADLARYMILNKHGGLYVDLDCKPSQTVSLLEALCQGPWPQKSLFFIEFTKPENWAQVSAAKFPIRKGRPEHPERIANFAFYATPDCPVIPRILDLLKTRVLENKDELDDYGVIYCTGPDCVTEIVQSHRPQVEVWPHELYLEHQGYGSWKRKPHFTLGQRLKSAPGRAYHILKSFLLKLSLGKSGNRNTGEHPHQ